MSNIEDTQLAFCNACGQETRHRCLREETKVGRDVIDEGQDICLDWSITHSMLQCCGCDEVSLKRVDRDFFDGANVSYFPPRVSRAKPRWFEALPIRYTDLLTEIYSALHADSRSLAMMGLRTIIDIFAVEKIGDAGSFSRKLESLKNAGHISERQRDYLDAALEAGNAAAHRGHRPSPQEVSAVADIVEHLLQSEILPAMAESLRKTIPKRS
jgi:hypothetical protein